VLGKKTLENEILTEVVKLAHEKKLISRMPLLSQDDTL
jgi:transposase